MDLFDEAIVAYRTALSSDPHYLKALFNMARLYHTQGDHDQAILYFEMVLECDPDHAQAYNNLGLIHEEMGERSEAVISFQKAAELDIFLPETHFNLVRALYYQHGGDLGPELVQSLIERLQMILCFTPNDATGQLIHQRIETFLDFLAFTL
jgi:tetratricopeptide (TPR) repeat protein